MKGRLNFHLTRPFLFLMLRRHKWLSCFIMLAVPCNSDTVPWIYPEISNSEWFAEGIFYLHLFANVPCFRKNHSDTFRAFNHKKSHAYPRLRPSLSGSKYLGCVGLACETRDARSV